MNRPLGVFGLTVCKCHIGTYRLSHLSSYGLENTVAGSGSNLSRFYSIFQYLCMYVPFPPLDYFVI